MSGADGRAEDEQGSAAAGWPAGGARCPVRAARGPRGALVLRVSHSEQDERSPSTADRPIESGYEDGAPIPHLSPEGAKREGSEAHAGPPRWAQVAAA